MYKCAAACLLGDIILVEQSGSRVGCYSSSEFKELFLKDYLEDPEGG
jgi:hypothetical protein